MKLVVHIDGGSRGNPGPAGVGVAIQDADTRQPLHEVGYFLGQTTNNVAEYQGLIRAAELLAHVRPGEVAIHSDSQLMVRQIQGQYKVKSADLKPLHTKALSLLNQLPAWSIEHVLRDQNKRADELANLAMDRRQSVLVRSCWPELDSEVEKATAGVQASSGPSWHACIDQPSPRCPAKVRRGERFTLGPRVEGGPCIYAAVAALNHCLSQLDAADEANHFTTPCPHCQAPITVRRRS